MLYTIHGFQQEVLLEFGCDANDALFLRWFSDFIHTGKMETIIEDEKVYHWINHQYVISQNPIMKIKSVEVFSRRLRKMEKENLLFAIERKLQGKTKKFYRFNPEVYERLTFHTRLKSRVSTQANNGREASHPTQKSGVHPTQKSGVHPTQKSGNSSIKEILLSKDKERGEKLPLSLIYYLSFFSLSEEELGCRTDQIEIFAHITERWAFQEACEFWKTKAYNPLNITGLFDRYQRILSNDNEKHDLVGSPNEPMSCRMRRPEPPPPSPLTEDEKKELVLRGEQKAREYFRQKGWAPAEIEKHVQQVRQTLGG